jgi:hypothetical protein
MAAPTIDAILNNIDLADSTTGWTGFNDGGGGAGSASLEQDIFIPNAAAVSKKVSGSSQDQGLHFQVGTPLDITADANKHIFVWVAVTTQAICNTIANGGLYLRLEDSLGNWSKWYLDGSDTFDPTRLFVRYVIDTSKTESENGGTACDLTDVEYFGVGIKSTGTSKSENLIIDRIDYGTGLRIEDGDASDPCNWQALFDGDMGATGAASKFGIIEKRGGIFYIKGALEIGDTASKTSLWLDTSGAVVEYENPLYHNGDALVSAIDADVLYKITLQGNGTGTTDISFGQVIGTGDDRQGLGGGTIQSAGPKFTIDGETDITDLDTVNLYGLTLVGAGVTQFSSSTKTDIIGCTFINCDEIQPNDAEFLNNTVIEPLPDRGLEMIATHNIKQVGFIAGADVAFAAARSWQVDVSATPDAFVEVTDDFNGVSGVDTATPFPAAEAAGDYWAVGHDRKFAKVTVDLATLGTGSPTVVWEYWNGSSWSSLVNVSDGTSAFTSDGDVTFNVPNDWAATSLNGERPQFYVRARLTATFTIDPTFDGTSGTGTLDEGIEHHVHVPVAGTYGWNALEFFGHSPAGLPKWHGENSAAATSLEDYDDSNQDGVQSFSGSNVEIAQEVIGNGGKLTRVRVWMRRNDASVTGNIDCVVYDSDDGSPPEPTGAILATSEPVAASDLVNDNTFRYIDFEFQDEVTLVNLQTYFFSVRYASADTIDVGTDTSSPTADGTLATYNGSTWTGDGTAAIAGFEVNTAGLVIINATNDANPTADEIEETNDIPGATVVNNPVTYTITGLVTGSEVRIFRTSDSLELAGVESSGTSFAYPYNWGGDVDIFVIIQKLTHKWRRVDDTLTSSDKDVPANQVPDPDYLNP